VEEAGFWRAARAMVKEIHIVTSWPGLAWPKLLVVSAVS